MDLPLHDLRARFLQAIGSRIPRLSKHAPKPRIPRGAWIFPLALILGVWANRGSREEGRIAWLRENPPAAEAWGSLLAARGFGPIEDPAWREKAFAEMPDVGRERAAALISEDHTTFALRTDGDWLFFGLARTDGSGGQTVKRELWEPLGLGWEAVSRFEALALPVFKTKPKSGSAEWRDARSVNY